MSLWASRLTCVANLWMYPSHWWIALIHKNNGFNRATTMSVNIRFYSPLWFAIQIELQHIAELLAYRREPGDLQNRCFEFSQIPAVFTFPLKWDTYTMRLQVSRYCWWSPAEQKPGSNAGFWVPCVCLKGSRCDSGTKRAVWTWYSLSVTQTATSFTHSVLSPLLSLWLHRLCNNVLVPLFNQVWPPAGRGYTWLGYQ